MIWWAKFKRYSRGYKKCHFSKAMTGTADDELESKEEIIIKMKEIKEHPVMCQSLG